MAKKMLIDATHPEETRVVVVDGNRVEEFDYESITRTQITGNIYLAKVTRVEPSLQAAFVDYGGNRHGFLAFSEIHPDYYQIPKADREALMAAELAHQQAEDQEDEQEAQNPKRKRRNNRKRAGEPRRQGRRGAQQLNLAPIKAPPPEALLAATEKADFWTDAAQNERPDASYELPDPSTTPDLSDVDEIQITRQPTEEEAAQFGDGPITEHIELPKADAADQPQEAAPADQAPEEAPQPEAAQAEAMGASSAETLAEAPEETEARRDAEQEDDSDEAEADAEDDDDEVEELGQDDALEEARPRRQRARMYKIQEVIKRRQIMLVQVVKEERGTKGAALTTYISLAGRYCVLMPNTARGGGISRKITNAADRKRLKALTQELEVPEGMGLIVRTAGAERTKAEVKRDYEYLLRQWAAVRDLTLRSVGPALIYEEGSLIKRAIRDLYNKDIEAVQVEGEEGYREAKDYMKMLMPSHAKNVQPYRDQTPLFIRNQIETHLAAMMNPTVQLKSGGYIVIGVTEALVAVDVNSGKSTKEASIEDTALKTNLEAAEEVARQLKLRDLAGLIVIDFIDMEDSKNDRAVEKRLKERLKHDRARIQVGRISSFGLLEMSRQRLRPGLLEATTSACPHCKGTGLVRSDESVALAAIRAIEEEGVRRKSMAVRLRAPVEVANYLMNFKREKLSAVEARYEIQALIEGDPTLASPEFAVERVRPVQRENLETRAIQVESGFSQHKTEDAPAEAVVEDAKPEEDQAAEEGREPRRRRRRRKVAEPEAEAAEADAPLEAEDAPAAPEPAEADAEADEESGRKRRGRRGGRRRKRKGDEADPLPVIDLASETAETEESEAQEASAPQQSAEEAPAKPRRKRRSRRKPKDEDETQETADLEAAPEAKPEEAATDETPKEASEEPQAPIQAEPEPIQSAARNESDDDEAPNELSGSTPPPKRPRMGWWSGRRG